MIDTLVHSAAVITVDRKRHVWTDGAIAILEGEIIDTGPSVQLQDKYEAKEEIDGSGMIAMPGLVNAHMHLPQVIMRGIQDNIEPMDKLVNYIWPIQGHFDEADALASTELGLLEMIKSGTTAFISTGLHPRYGIDRLAESVTKSGMRAALSKYVFDLTAYALDDTALHEGMLEDGETSMNHARSLIEKWHGSGDGRLQIWFSPRSVGGCSKELLAQVAKEARDTGVGITAHWSEVPNNVDYTLETYGLRPVRFAESVGLLGPNVTFAHGIYFDDDEILLLADSGTNICHCPVCNSKLAMGVAKVPQMLGAGVNVCLGNDGMPVNNTADMFREMRTTVLLHRVVGEDPLYPTAAEAIEMATIRGARALRLETEIGSIEPGKRADIILLNAHNPHMVPLHDPVSAVVWAANGSDVHTVMIDGDIVMRDRQVLTIDENRALREAEGRKQKILDQAGVQAGHVWPVN